MNEHVVFITGASGYVGEMLCDQFSKRPDVAKIVALDKEPQTDWGKEIPKVTYVRHNLADDGWQEQVAAHQPTVVIHTAWQIRELYGERDKQWRWNIEGSDNVFDFALSTPGVERLVYFSTAASYAAKVDNTFTHHFTEAEGFRDDEYSYAKEKKVSEEHLLEKYEAAKAAGRTTPKISIVRPAAITGPRGRFQRVRFGLQSALQGNLKKGFLNRIVSLLTMFMPATKGWVRQFIHEDDVTDIVAQFSFAPITWDYEAYNMTSVSETVYAKDMGKAVGKRILPIYPWMARLAFWFFWHATQGKVPTAAHVWRFYSYPIVMSGEKLATVYTCKYSSLDAIRYTDGRYEDWVPESKRSTRPTQAA